ncbi:MAG TPA: MBL fold metallo-hydrolase [Candidatus Binataceae bacterium]|nr:MBL fold metallo-hydrolase [Candidatus Binataceae bacterium]
MSRSIVATNFLVCICLIAISPARAGAQAPAPGAVLIVMLGTGTPQPNPDRQGPSLAIVAGGRAYIVDAGAGVVRRASAALLEGIAELRPDRLGIAFLTHLHSDHTIGLPDLILTPWVLGRSRALALYGPAGTSAMAANLLRAYAQDIDVRIHGLEHANPTGYRVAAHDIEPGLVYQDANVKVIAFAVQHGSWKEALGYRFEARGKTIVISGDTRPSDNVIKACNGCDVLIHEAYSGQTPPVPLDTTRWRAYLAAFHTSAEQLGELAQRARPKMVVLTHTMPFAGSSGAQLVAEVKQHYTGPVIWPRDLDVIAP